MHQELALVNERLDINRVALGLAGFHQAGGGEIAGPEDFAAVLVDREEARGPGLGDVDVPFVPASVTKIMTAYVTFDALKSGRLKPDQKITVSEKAHMQAPSKVGLPVGADMPVDLAIRALIVI